jgi:hypothetical protein
MFRGKFDFSSIRDRLTNRVRSNQRLVGTLVSAIFLFNAVLIGSAQSASDPGVTLPDEKSGYQIQLVYVETSSAEGSNYQLNGKIESWVSQLQSWLRIKTGKELIFDTHQGKLDIAYLKFDGDIEYEKKSDDQLIRKYRELNPTTHFGKTLAFVVDQTRPVGRNLCGWASPNKGFALIFPNLTYSDGSECTEDESTTKINAGFSYPAQSLLHEIIHSYGIKGHVCVDSTDLMHGSPECGEEGMMRDFEKPVTFDLTEQHYFGGDRAGVDLKTLKIWSDGSGQKRPDFSLAGTCWKNELCSFPEQTFPEQGTVQLQVRAGAKWLTVNSVKGQLSNCEECYKYSFKNSHRFTKAGTYQYRIVKLATKKYRAYTSTSKGVRVLN